MNILNFSKNLSRIQYLPPELAGDVVAIGGNLSWQTLLEAYRKGMFPWYEKGEPILWWSPISRMVLYSENLKISKSLRKLLKENNFKLTSNQAFEQVIRACASIPRKEGNGSWIHPEMIEAYTALNQNGFAKSVEVWQENELVGGLYGIDLGGVFCGESMFSKVSGASKVGFVWWVNQLQLKGCKLIDCQVYTDYLASFGASEIPRKLFLEELNKWKTV